MTESTQMSSTDWLGQPALAIETAAVRLVTVPHMGAKIVSLYDKVRAHEWLLPPIDRPFRPAAYAASFVAQDMSGWDEMFPTIDSCHYPLPGPYQGAALPDHGEVWAIPWAQSADDPAALRLSVEGRALPYRLTRTIRALDAHTLRLEFEALNTGAAPFLGFWTAHPQFAADASTRIILPPPVTEVVNVKPLPDWPAPGASVSWPQMTTLSGQPIRLDQVGPASQRTHRKVYLPPQRPVTWAALRQGDDGPWLRLAWDAATVPYLGVWVDEGTYNAAPTAALEPSTGYYDTIPVAVENARAVTFAPGQPVRWQLDIRLGAGALPPASEPA